MQFRFTGLANEAAIKLEDQIDVLTRNGVRHTEMRRVGGRDILTHTPKELADIKRRVDDKGFGVYSIATPIGKTPITDDFRLTLDELDKAINAAQVMQCRLIRIFTFYIPQGKPSGDYAQEAIARLAEMTARVEKNGLVLALENESNIFGQTIENNRLISESIPSPALQFIFDAGNFIRDNIVPYPDAYLALKGRISHFHIKDRKFGEEEFVVSGEGDARMEEMLKAAYQEGFDGWLSIEPHLTYRRDLSMARQFTVAANALKRMLNAAFGASLEELDPGTFD